jgi:hypothetical protein
MRMSAGWLHETRSGRGATVITGEAVGSAVAIGVIGFLVTFGIDVAQRGRTTRSESFRSSLLFGITWGICWLLAAMVNLPEVRLEPPLSTILVVVICLVATAGSLVFFRMMLRDGSRED